MRPAKALVLGVIALCLAAGCSGPAPRSGRPEPPAKSGVPARPPKPVAADAAPGRAPGGGQPSASDTEAPPPAGPALPAGPVLVVPARDTPLHVTVALPEGLDAPSPCRLVESGEAGEPGKGAPAEIVASDGTRLLIATIEPRGAGSAEEAGAARRFVLAAGRGEGGEEFALGPVSDRSLALDAGGRPLLVYNHGTIGREGVPARYDRANYFHPVYGLDGEVLTDDFPKDHYHHRGIFWAWPSMREGDGKEGAFESWIPKSFEYRFERWACRHAGPGGAALGAETGWHAAGKRIVHERMLVVVHRSLGDSRAIDFELTWTATDVPVTLKGAGGKGYGGFTFRSAPRKDTVITAPGGRTKEDLVAKRLSWADISGIFEGPAGAGPVTSGVAVLVAPDHPGFPPEWLTRHYGPLCVGWPGLKEGTLEPGKPVTCRYRMWFHRGVPDAGAVQAAYDAYAKGLEARWEERKP